MKLTLAIAGTSMPCVESNTICARRHVTTDPLSRRVSPQQPAALINVEIADMHSFSHAPIKTDPARLTVDAPLQRWWSRP